MAFFMILFWHLSVEILRDQDACNMDEIQIQSILS
jgi:hypothetical protein